MIFDDNDAVIPRPWHGQFEISFKSAHVVIVVYIDKNYAFCFK